MVDVPVRVGVEWYLQKRYIEDVVKSRHVREHLVLLLHNVVQVQNLLHRDTQNGKLEHPVNLVGVGIGRQERLALGSDGPTRSNQVLECLELAFDLDYRAFFDDSVELLFLGASACKLIIVNQGGRASAFFLWLRVRVRCERHFRRVVLLT